MLLNTICITALYLFPHAMLGAQSGSRPPATAWVHGTVEDPQGAVLPDFTVTVASEHYTCQVESNTEGKFNCQVPVGEYRVTAKSPGFLPYQRGAIRLAAGDHKRLVIRPPFAVPTEHNAKARAQLKYKELPTKGGPNALLRYETSSQSPQGETFGGRHLMLSIDDLAVYAEQIVCTPALSCRASGAVTVEIAGERLTGFEATVELSERSLILRREPTVLRHF
jgi:hypothetical protein